MDRSHCNQLLQALIGRGLHTSGSEIINGYSLGQRVDGVASRIARYRGDMTAEDVDDAEARSRVNIVVWVGTG